MQAEAGWKSLVCNLSRILSVHVKPNNSDGVKSSSSDNWQASCSFHADLSFRLCSVSVSTQQTVFLVSL